MRKNTTLRVAAVLLALTLITSCFVGGTFAKYTSKVSGGENARVAYWGFDNNATLTFDLFADTYGSTDVDSQNGDNVIAPGTGRTATFRFDYKPNTADGATAPEVDYQFNVVATGTCAAEIENNPNIKWYLDGVEKDTFEDVKTAINNMTETVEANNLPAAFEQDTYHTVSWKWVFETADDADPDNGSEMATQDDQDTDMGNMDALPEIDLTITITATQIDGQAASEPSAPVAP